MDTIDDWYDSNFSLALERRIKYTVEMSVLKRNYIPSFLCKHHEVYRIENWEGEDQLFPFNEGSVKYLADRMDAQFMYPNFILKNCGALVKRIYDLGRTTVTEDIIKAEEKHLEYLIKEQ